MKTIPAPASAAGPVMEVRRNVKLPFNVCVLHRCYPTSPAKQQDGRGSILPPQNIWFSFGATREGKKKKKGWMRRLFLRRVIVAETNCGVDQGRQLCCWIHPAVGRQDLSRKGWCVLWLWSPGGVATLNVSWRLLQTVSHNYYVTSASFCCYVSC